MLEKNQNENLCNKNLYIVMNKPAGYVCSAVSDSHKTVYELLPPEMRELVPFNPCSCRTRDAR